MAAIVLVHLVQRVEHILREAHALGGFQVRANHVRDEGVDDRAVVAAQHADHRPR